MTNTMKLGDYVATIEFDEELKMFSGSVVNLTSPVMFYATSVKGLEAEFSKSVETYLKVCEEHDIVPDKPFSGRLNIRMEPELHRMVSIAAVSMGVPRNRYILTKIKQGLIEDGVMTRRVVLKRSRTASKTVAKRRGRRGVKQKV